MDNVSVRAACGYCNPAIEYKPLHWLDVPTGCVSSMAKANLGHQMRYSVETLESELARTPMRHVLQLVFEEGADRNLAYWALYADGVLAADGGAEFARACFQEGAGVFRDVCRDAVTAAEKEGLAPLDERDFRLPGICRDMFAVHACRPRP